MRNDWPIKRLGEIVTFQTGKLDSNASEIGGAYPFFTCSPTTLAISHFAFNEETVLLAGNNANGVFSVKYYNGKFNAYQRTYIISPINRTEVSVLWLYYQIKIVTTVFQQLAVGTATKFLTKKILDAFEVALPSYAEQEKIAHQLSSLDNKIELNRQTNETLEKMAQALFESWFVDFDPVIDNALEAGNAIPDELQDRAERRQQQLAKPDHQPLPDDIRQQFPSEFELTEALGWVPMGWQVSPLSKLADLTTSSINPAKEPDKKWLHYSLPAFDKGKIPAQDMGSEIKSGKYWIPKSAVLVSKLNPHTPRVWLPEIANIGASICSTEFMPFVPRKEDWREYLYALMCSEFMNNELSSRVTGTTGSHQRVRPKEIAILPILMPPNDAITVLSSKLKAYYEKIQQGITNNVVLEILRDTLLSKLISGELRLPSDALSDAELESADTAP